MPLERVAPAFYMSASDCGGRRLLPPHPPRVFFIDLISPPYRWLNEKPRLSAGFFLRVPALAGDVVQDGSQDNHRQ